MFKFENNEYIYSQYPDLDTKIKIHLRSYWLGSIMVLISIGYSLAHVSSLDNISWVSLFLPITVVIVLYCTLDEIHSMRAAKRIALKEYGPDAI